MHPLVFRAAHGRISVPLSDWLTGALCDLADRTRDAGAPLDVSLDTARAVVQARSGVRLTPVETTALLRSLVALRRRRIEVAALASMAHALTTLRDAAARLAPPDTPGRRPPPDDDVLRN